MIKLTINIDEIDYSAVAELALPLLSEKLKNSPEAGGLLKSFIHNGDVSMAVAKAALAVMPQKMKDDMAVSLINKYKNKIIEAIENECSKRDITVSVSSIEAEYTDTKEE